MNTHTVIAALAFSVIIPCQAVAKPFYIGKWGPDKSECKIEPWEISETKLSNYEIECTLNDHKNVGATVVYNASCREEGDDKYLSLKISFIQKSDGRLSVFVGKNEHSLFPCSKWGVK